MNKILINVRPEKIAKILYKEINTIETKSFPKCVFPCEVYVYCSDEQPFSKKYMQSIENQYSNIDFSKLKRKVIGKFILNNVIENQDSCLWEISDFVLLEKIKDLKDFNLTKPPIYWRYLSKNNKIWTKKYIKRKMDILKKDNVVKLITEIKNIDKKEIQKMTVNQIVDTYSEDIINYYKMKNMEE